jgi:membrane-bound lytic murein transglycosylase D
MLKNQPIRYIPRCPSSQSWCLSATVILFLLFIHLIQAQPLFAASSFPRHPVIDKNVRFWEAIYSRYSTSQAVVHDSNDLGIIYEVLPIFSHRLPGASKINRPIYKGVKSKYAQILKQLSKGVKPKTSDEKRVAALFAGASRKRLAKAAQSVRVQIGQKDRFIEGVIRSGAYMAQIKKIFKSQGLPQELAYLPHVESSFNLKAYSKFGASGIWQFTRSTGKQYLKINYVVDERQDPLLASLAAAKFLKSNYRLLGSWPLALTAYNYGPAGMLRAKKAHLSYERIFSNYDKGYFKFASRNFYSEFLAALRVAKKLERDPALSLDSPRPTLRLRLPSYLAANDLCNFFGISVSTLKKYNPALRRSVLQGKKYIPKGYTIHLPNNSSNKALMAKIPSRLYHAKQKPTRFYRVRAGDTAGKIARMHRISLRSLRSANNLNRDATIFIGQNLRIPEKTTPATPRSQAQPKQRRPATMNTASKGQTQLPELRGNKKRKPNWQNVQKARSVVLGKLGVHDLHTSSGVKRGKIIIQPEESLEILAAWLGVSAESLRTLNNFRTDRTLHPDETIIITLQNRSANAFEEKRFDFHLKTEEDFFSMYKIVGVSSYMVRPGDTIWEICRERFDLPLWLLKKYNASLDFSRLRSSQRLTIPIVKTI